MINLLMVNYEFPPLGGGGGRAHQNLLRQFAAQADLRIDVVTSMQGKGMQTDPFSENITLHKVGIRKKNLHYWSKWEVVEWLGKSRRVYDQLLRQNIYDLGHAFFAFPSGWLHYRSRERLPYILSLRGSDVPGYNVRLGLDYNLLKGLFQKIWASADAVIANSSGLGQLAGQFTPDLPIGVIPNGIDTEQYTPAPESSLQEPLQILTVARLIQRKRICLSMNAVKAALSAGLDVHFNIAGEGNLLTSLKQLASGWGIADRVHFLGRVEPEQMPELYRKNHLFLMTSQHEGMSNAMLEAMACGLPIVTTACEGVEELIDDNGLVVASSQPEPIGEAIAAILRDETKWKAMSAAARRRAETFSWEATARQYLDLYRGVLEKRNA